MRSRTTVPPSQGAATQDMADPAPFSPSVTAGQHVRLPDAALEAMQLLMDAAPAPSPRLRAAARRQRP
jgi:hypothetical protein